MLGSLWVVFALISSVFFALAFSINGRFKADGLLIAFWRSFIVAVVLTPVLFVFELPKSPLFYFSVLAVGVVGAVADILSYRSAKIHGAGGTTRMMNLRVPVGVALGFVVFPSSWLLLQGKGFFSIAFAILSLLVCMVALVLMNKKPVSRAVFNTMIWPVLLYCVADIFHKLGVVQEVSLLNTLIFVVLMAWVMTLTIGIIGVLMRKRGWFSAPNIIKHGGVLAGIWLCLVFVKGLALIGMPNPGYFPIFAGLSTLWVTVHHKVFNIPDHTSPVAGLFLMLGAMSLAYFVS